MKEHDEERELLAQEDDLLRSARALSPSEQKALRAAARATLAKDRRINIRLSSRDLEALQSQANRYGMPYQTLISSILHRYATGDLLPERAAPATRKTGPWAG